MEFSKTFKNQICLDYKKKVSIIPEFRTQVKGMIRGLPVLWFWKRHVF